MKTLFITGGGGFLGNILLKIIDPTHYNTIYCLCRSGELTISNLDFANNIKIIKGNLLDIDSYSEALARSDIVLHLAALTGKEKTSEYFRVNTKGTEYLVRECGRLGVKKILFVSTIAVNFPDLSHYYYAQSKKKAEEIVKHSRLKFSIVRPTMIIGKDGAIWLNLSKLGGGLFPILFGDGKVKIQPIYGEDLSKLLILIIDDDIFRNETYDLGGPESLSFEEFIQLIHREYKGKYHPTIHFPLGFILSVLGIMEKYIYSFLPINSGQLSPFRFDSIASPNHLYDRHELDMLSPKDMIRCIVEKESSEITFNKLSKECILFCKYLIDVVPNTYFIDKYYKAHVKKRQELEKSKTTFDRLLIRFGTKNIRFTKLVDCYTRLFFRKSIFQKKIILILAILESMYPYYEHLDSIDFKSKLMFFSTMFLKSLSFLFKSILSIVIIGPLHVVLSVMSITKHAE